MSQSTLSKSDRRFLKSAGVSPEETPLVADRMALAERIAKHQAPAQVKVDPDAARLELIRLALRRLLEASERDAHPTE